MRKAAPKFRLTSCEAALQELHTRMPFRYGNATMTGAPLLMVRLQIESADGKRAMGYAADSLPPRWFDKDPARTFRENVADQLAAFERAREIYLLLGDNQARTAAGHWLEAYPRILEETTTGVNPLTRAFSSSFFERAMADAVCRLKGLSFFEALKQEAFGLEIAKALPRKPLTTIHCRHTVGLVDPIVAAEIPANERVKDGLPQALEEDIEAYGLTHFKVKVGGEHDRDLDRLSRMAPLLAQRCRKGYRVSLDGNEQYRDPAALERLLAALAAKPYGKEFLDAIIFIEQPLPREIALAEAAGAGVKRLAALKPITIDESDDQLDSFKRAVDLGYTGVSHKNCKGLFKSLQNRVLIRQLNAERGAEVFFQTGEDLTNVPVVPLHEDLAALAALGIEHAERNGHHYYRGLDHLPAGEAEAALAAHPDLYEEREGSIFLRVQDGRIALESIHKPGFGYACEIAFAERTPLPEWSLERVEGLGAAAPVKAAGGSRPAAARGRKQPDRGKAEMRSSPE
jgi:hypothetical protein